MLQLPEPYLSIVAVNVAELSWVKGLRKETDCYEVLCVYDHSNLKEKNEKNSWRLIKLVETIIITCPVFSFEKKSETKKEKFIFHIFWFNDGAS